ncbi:jg2425, partial [Pararge aegeria aegeria]
PRQCTLFARFAPKPEHPQEIVVEGNHVIGIVQEAYERRKPEGHSRYLRSELKRAKR